MGWTKPLLQDTYRLTLWCEYDDQPHPWQPAEYKFHRPRDWLVTVAPYALVVLKILRLAVNVAAPIATGPIATLADVDLESVRDDLDAMDKLLDQLPPHRPDTLAASGQAAQSIQAEGPELRALRANSPSLIPTGRSTGCTLLRPRSATSGGFAKTIKRPTTLSLALTARPNGRHSGPGSRTGGCAGEPGWKPDWPEVSSVSLIRAVDTHPLR